ncbi:MAG: hypothetical protein CMH22_06275 [Methylophaga sp.]|nr:hypothetical protein [Methylophaga sp.]|tara:strand:- start:34494 stop:34865 length:372 start_codon:yes stop_codon:yes gene_type:complete
MSIPLYKSKTKYKHEVELVDRIISIYSTIKKDKKNQILPFEKEILIYYILNGFSKETKEIIKTEKKKNNSQIDTANCNLRRKGFLIKGNKNQKISYVKEEIQEMVDSFLNNKNQFYVIQFEKK